ncbi:alpha/beta fold hydrolase [Nocardioides marmoribigeumensis]|uniref:Pimeloyl-ACP methyl ester carboxylesterase n=1 Tax=Nocardioides marmoribigeumensis TaxID=433649 RepID=A0ABU2BQ61_9ACTN|nr:alpha/beta fold hydrolase [Nocardioides marmoribigeumensis]MDR7360762.1 pimeloyl-ACP methyl ester carboxylesterase [Nocardioides marmoribigeumensis]
MRGTEDPLEVQYVTIHGHRRAFVKAGSGPAILLLHGMACDHTTWNPIIRRLARRHTVIAPDLLGHGRSDKPRADYSVGGYANGMRDLLTVLGIDRVTVVGHSLGGGVAMQFAYQFPERTERVALIAPGGLGREVTPIIRAVTLPGFHTAMGLATLPGVRHAVTGSLRGLKRTGHPVLRDLGEIADIVEHLKDPRSRRALAHVVRACVDLRGQIITMVDRAYLTQEMPLCLIWGQDDQVIPATHAARIRSVAPGVRVTITPGCGHFPHKEDPELVVSTLERFIRTTQPATHHRGRWRALLKNGAPAGVVIPDSRVVTIA